MKKTWVGSIAYSWSQYDDKIWGWLGKNFPSNKYPGRGQMGWLDHWDYAEAWGLLAVAGCTFDYSYDEDVPVQYVDVPGDVSIGIFYNGEIDDLISRLNKIIREG